MPKLAGLFLAIVSFTAFGDDTTFTFRIQDDPVSYDWHDYANLYVTSNIMEGLVGINDSLQPVPRLARSWKTSKDGKTVTFELRKKVLWSDGVELTARDFAYAWKRILTPATASPSAYYLFDITGARDFNTGKLSDFDKVGIRVIDDYHLQVQLSQPISFWPTVTSFMSFFPMRKDIIEKYGKDWTAPGKIVTLGPFVLTSVAPAQQIVLTRNPLYKGATTNIQKVVAMIIREDRTAANMFELGKLDFTGADSLDDKSLAGAVKFPMLETMSLQINIQGGPAQDKGVRHAIAMAIDKSKIPPIFHSAESAADAWVPPIMMKFAQTGLPFDPEKARKELAATGLAPGTRFTFLVNANNENCIRLAEFVQQELRKNLGLNVDLQMNDLKTNIALRKAHQYPLYFYDWVADYPDPDSFMAIFLKGTGENTTGYSSDDYDKLVMQARAETDGKIRQKQYFRMHQILEQDEAVLIPLYHVAKLAFVSKRVKGVKVTPFFNFPLRDVQIGEIERAGL